VSDEFNEISNRNRELEEQDTIAPLRGIWTYQEFSKNDMILILVCPQYSA
jgi:hypothetical protein